MDQSKLLLNDDETKILSEFFQLNRHKDITIEELSHFMFVNLNVKWSTHDPRTRVYLQEIIQYFKKTKKLRRF